MLKKFLRKIVIISVVMVCGLAMLSFFGPDAPALGVSNGRLSECPGSPNCVSSMTEMEDFAMEPIPFSDSANSPEDEMSRLKQIIAEEFPRSNLISSEDNYLRYEFSTLVFRFVDDVEFLIVPEEKLIHFRSASRVGKSDLGQNRKRMKKIRRLMSQ